MAYLFMAVALHNDLLMHLTIAKQIPSMDLDHFYTIKLVMVTRNVRNIYIYDFSGRARVAQSV
jgi:hypothetical protein